MPSSDVDVLIIPINRAGQELLRNNVGREITNYDIFTLAPQAYINALTPSNIIIAFQGQFRVLSTRIIPAAGNGESCLGPVFPPFSNSHQYRFQIRLRLVDVFRIVWTKK